MRKEVWQTGRRLLGVQPGDQEASSKAGAFIGKLVNEHTIAIVLEVLRDVSTMEARPLRMQDYLVACCQRASGKREPPRSRAEEREAIADSYTNVEGGQDGENDDGFIDADARVVG